MERGMRLLIAALLIAGLPVGAYAQLDVPGSRNQSRTGPPPEKPAYTVTDRDYNSALKRIPEAKGKFDPWGGVREEPAPKSRKKN
jgi:hypothetical protein